MITADQFIRVGGNIWSGNTDDAATVVEAANYFNAVGVAMGQASSGFIVMRIDVDGTETCRMYTLSKASNGNVTATRVS